MRMSIEQKKKRRRRRSSECLSRMTLLTLTFLLTLTLTFGVTQSQSMSSVSSSRECEELESNVVESGVTWNGFECVTLPGFPCRGLKGLRGLGVPTRKCVAHAYCSPQSGVCECETGFIPTHANRVCFLTHGVECSDYWPCAGERGLKCRENRSKVTATPSSRTRTLLPQMSCECEDGYGWVKDQNQCIQLPTTPTPTTSSTGSPPKLPPPFAPVIVANYHPAPVFIIVPPSTAPSVSVSSGSSSTTFLLHVLVLFLILLLTWS